MLILSNDDIRAVFSMAEAVPVLKQVYRDYAEGRAHGTTTRLDTRVTLDDAGRFYSFMSMEGTTPEGDVMALRFNANHERFVTVEEKTKKVHLPAASGDRYLGLVLLISMHDTRPLALLHESYLSPIRVGASSALAAHYLARPDAGDVALLGTGDQARAQLLGLAEVRDLRRVQVFSRTAARRSAFAEEMRAATGVPVEPAPDARSAVEGADLVVAATNSLDPVFSVDWLTGGAHVGAIVPGEVDPRTYERSEVTIVNAKMPFGNERGFIAREDRDWSQYSDLAELVSGRCAGRTDDAQVTFFMNNAGVGFQFAACGLKAYELARTQGLGYEVPTDVLLQSLRAWPAAADDAGKARGHG